MTSTDITFIPTAAAFKLSRGPYGNLSNMTGHFALKPTTSGSPAPKPSTRP